MSAVILAGGLGSRLGSLTADLPKPLISVAGKPLIEHVSDQLVAVGISYVVITVGYLGVMVEDWAKGRFLALRDGGTTMAESFLWAAQRCEHNTVLGLSCDTLVPRTALEHLCSFHGSSVAAATLLLTTESGQEQKKWSYQISKDGTLEAIKASNDVSSLERLGVWQRLHPTSPRDSAVPMTRFRALSSFNVAGTSCWDCLSSQASASKPRSPTSRCTTSIHQRRSLKPLTFFILIQASSHFERRSTSEAGVELQRSCRGSRANIGSPLDILGPWFLRYSRNHGQGNRWRRVDP
jgi:GTP:adenosylcobinamide-phosphate guanylyltransferase